MPLTEKQLSANRSNATKSTGPKRPAIRQNAAAFDSLANAILIQGESRPEFVALLHSLHAEFLPQTPSERTLVENLATHQWLLLRTLTLESAALTHEMNQRAKSSDPESSLSSAMHSYRALADKSRHAEFRRDANRFDRHYHRTLHALHRIREEKEKQKNSAPIDEQLTENKESASEVEPRESH